jgi:Zn-dependent peptidase ImmA (M78 family)
VFQEATPLEKQNSRTSDDFTEKMRDMIAAGLLMPKAIFIREATDMWPSFSSIQAIADRFDVTPKAAQRRILDLRIWNCAVGGILYIPDGEGHEREILQRLNNRVQERWS